MKKIAVSIIKGLLRIIDFVNSVFGSSLSIISYYCTLRTCLEHSSIRERKENEGQEFMGKQGTSNENLDQASSIGLLVGNRLHV